MACTLENPCSCVGNCVGDPDPGPPTNCTCLDLGYITVYPDDSVGPCYQTGTVSFTDCYDFCACENENATLTVMSITPEDAVVVNTINTAGMSFTTNPDVVDAYDKVEIVIKAVCTADFDDTVQLGDFTTITIFIKDPCKNVICGSGEACDECSGDCEPDVNLTVS